MPHIATPHLAYPFEFITHYGQQAAKVWEQDSTEEIGTCIEIILRCPIGFRDELPEFGIEQPEFGQAPLDTESIHSALHEWETRAEVPLEEYGDSLEEVIRHIRLEIIESGLERQ